ncbi:hypothetical protein GOODEAATRI_002477 [Goodea atripinnis]|uniref:Uncharacterized protein n=1 Tax=Goodea atripinnis TaxID=208336 RepID=A0ABV0NRA0_9TELE
MASDLEELIFIPAASHSAANRPSACCRSWLEGASRTTSSAQRRDEIHWSPNQTPSGPWLRLEILSIKVMNRTGYKNFINPNYFSKVENYVPILSILQQEEFPALSLGEPLQIQLYSLTC